MVLRTVKPKPKPKYGYVEDGKSYSYAEDGYGYSKGDGKGYIRNDKLKTQ